MSFHRCALNSLAAYVALKDRRWCCMDFLCFTMGEEHEKRTETSPTHPEVHQLPPATSKSIPKQNRLSPDSLPGILHSQQQSFFSWQYSQTLQDSNRACFLLQEYIPTCLFAPASCRSPGRWRYSKRTSWDPNVQKYHHQGTRTKRNVPSNCLNSSLY